MYSDDLRNYEMNDIYLIYFQILIKMFVFIYIYTVPTYITN